MQAARNSTVRFQLAVSVFLLSLCSCSTTAFASKRVALVIGNGAYESVPILSNPRNDAVDISGKLSNLGFDVVSGTDADLSTLKIQLRRFSRKLSDADVALFYYSGHAIQVQDENYLVPTDATLSTELDVDLETLSLNSILRQMNRQARVNLVFLDACRDNPFLNRLQSGTRNVGASRGLSRVENDNIGSVIVFATAPGDVAYDGIGRNSPFTEAMLRHIDTPGQDISLMLRKVRRDVVEATNNKQIPWERSSLTDTFYFAGATNPQNLPQSLSTSNQPSNTGAVMPIGRLTVKVNPVGAHIQILNIAPVYKPGIELELNQQYDILVSSTGYSSWRGSVQMTDTEQVLSVVLRESSVQSLSSLEPQPSNPKPPVKEPEL